MKIFSFIGTFAVVGTIFTACNSDSNELYGEGSVVFNVSADEQIVDSRAAVQIATPDTLIVAAYKDVDELYKSIKAPLTEGVAAPFEWIVASNTYNFVATNNLSADQIYAANGGRGEAWFYASKEMTVVTGESFDIDLTASVKNYKVTIEYSDDFNVLENCVATLYTASASERKIEYPYGEDAGDAWYNAGSKLCMDLSFTYNGVKKSKHYGDVLSALAPEGIAQEGYWYHLTLTPTVASGDISISVSSTIEQVNGGIDVNPKS
ncbi:MAG: DUF4493 domain-containing protein [Marinifilaceae bacterium]|nr:DUF4493 domain-containing protein [Marinifilaceae bacterium]